MNVKILVAPILAVTLALFLAGAISYLPVTPAPSDQINGLQTSGGFSANNQAAPTAAPRPQAVASVAILASPIIFIAGAVIIGILAVVLLFRERT